MPATAKKRAAEIGSSSGNGQKRQRVTESKAGGGTSKADAATEVKHWVDTTQICYDPKNPKSKGSTSFKRYAAYSRAKTVAEALKLGAKRADLAWDYQRGHVKCTGGRSAAVKAGGRGGAPKSNIKACALPKKALPFKPLRAVAKPSDATWFSDGIRLKSGAIMPVVGFGTYKLKKGQAAGTVLEALKAGYRAVDSAQVYENEGDVGAALKASGLPRESYFVETKVWRSSHGYERTLKAANQSLARLGTSYIDLYLIHWPGCKTGWPLPKGTCCPPDWTPAMRDGGKNGTWRAMEQLYDEGKIKALGVSNYSIRHLQQLLKSCRIKPMVNQVEFHPRLVQTKLLDFCKSKGITVQAYASLGSGDALQTESFMAFEPVVAAAKAHKVTPAQVLLRWAMEKGAHVVPKSVRPERMAENAGVFKFHLSKKEVAAIDALSTNTRYAWKGLDPDTIK